MCGLNPEANTCRNGSPSIEWSIAFGGPEKDVAYSVQQTRDEGYVVTGRSESLGKDMSGVFLARFDIKGNLLWNKAFGKAKMDLGFSVQQTFDDGYVVVGTTECSIEGKSSVYLFKTDSEGTLVWSRTFGKDSEGRSVQQTMDGGYIVAGSIASHHDPKLDVFLAKTDSEGNLVWSKTFGGPGNDRGRCVRQTTDGGYVIAGITESFGAGKNDVYLIKTDSEGNLVWSKTFGGSEDELGHSVQQTKDGGYIVTGTTQSFGAGKDDVYLIKTDSEGNLVWSRTFGGPERDIGFYGQQTRDGGYVIVGFTQSFGAGDFDIYLIKTDSEGNLVWSKTFGGPGNDRARLVQQTTDGGYVVAGETNNRAYLIKLVPEPLAS